MKRLMILALLLCISASVTAYENTYAVIVGVADYKDDNAANDLPYTLNNTDAMYKFLKSKRGGSVPALNICLLTDSRATKENIIKQAKALFAKAKKNDRVIFYFGGHGGPGCFIPYDFDGYFDSTLTYEDIKSIFRCARCNTKLMFADACYSGGIRGEKFKIMHRGKVTKPISTDKLNIAVMVASKADEFSWQTSDFQMGVFTYYLIEGLGGAANRDGNGFVTIQELYYYVYHKAIEKTRGFESVQTPQLFGKFDLRLIVAKV